MFLAIWFYLGNFCKLYTHKNAPTSWHHDNFISVTHPKVPAAPVQGTHSSGVQWRLSPSQGVFLVKDWGWRLPLQGFDPQELLCY